MTKAVEKLYEAQEIDHRRLTRLEGQTSLLAKMTKTAFQHIDYQLLHLDTKLNSTVQHMTEFFKRTETHFRFTWEALVSNRLAIHLLSCKVIRIGKRVQPDISKARQQVNIDRPAYNKTDKQCRTRTTITARLPDG